MQLVLPNGRIPQSLIDSISGNVRKAGVGPLHAIYFIQQWANFQTLEVSRMRDEREGSLRLLLRQCPSERSPHTYIRPGSTPALGDRFSAWQTDMIPYPNSAVTFAHWTNLWEGAHWLRMSWST